MRSRPASSALPWLVLLPAAAAALRRLDDGDTWWHLASGRWIAEHHAVPLRDTLSYTVADHAWINLQWLWDLAAYAISGLGGPGALVLASAACWVAGIALLILNVRRHAGPVVTSVLCAWVLLIVQERFVARPEMISFLFLQVLLWLLAGARRPAGRSAWLLAPLLVLWVNLHSLFVIGLWVIVCQVAAVLVAEHLPLPVGWRTASAMDRPQQRRLLLASALVLPALLLNPYALRGVTFPLELLSRFDKHSAYASIGEFGDPFAALLDGPVTGAYQVLLVCGALVVALAAWTSLDPRPPRRPAGAAVEDGFDLAGLLTFAGLAYLGLLAHRNMAVFATGTAPFIARRLSLLQARWLPEPARRTPAWRVAAVAVVAASCLASTVFVAGNFFYRLTGTVHEFGLGALDGAAPVRAASFVKELDLPGPMYNDLTTGGYLSWARARPEGVYIDARLEVYDEFFLDYRARLADPAAWSARADELGINAVLLSHLWRNRYTLIGWLEESPDWERVYFDEVAMIWVRARGNEEAIARARSAFVAREEANRQRLLEPPRTWGYPAGRVAALDAYALVLSNLGRQQDAAALFARTLEYDLPRVDARENSLWLADYYRNQGDLINTGRYIRLAQRADPDHENVRRAVEWLGQQ